MFSWVTRLIPALGGQIKLTKAKFVGCFFFSMVLRLRQDSVSFVYRQFRICLIYFFFYLGNIILFNKQVLQYILIIGGFSLIFTDNAIKN